MNKEQFGVEIVATTDKFKSKMNEIKNLGKQAADRIKHSFKTGTSNIASNIEKMATKARNSFKKMVLGIIGARSAFLALRKAVGAYMAYDTELNQRLSNTWSALGAQLAPVIEFIINLFAKAVAYINLFIQALTGINMIARANTKALNAQAGAAKSATKALTSLDEITNIQKDEGGGGGGAGIDPIELPEVSMSDFMKNLLDNIKKGNWYEVGKIIADKLNDVLGSINWDKIKQKAENIGTNIALFLNGGIENANWKLVGGTIAEGLNTAFRFLYQFISTLNFAAIGKAVADTLTGFFEKAEWDKIGKTVSEFIAKSLEFGAALFENLDVNLIADSLGTLIENLDWNKIIDRWYKAMLQLSPKINLLIVKLVGYAIAGLADALISWVTQVTKYGFKIGKSILEGIINGITDGFVGLINTITTKFNQFLQKIRDILGIHSPSTVMYDIGLNLIEGFRQGLSGIWNRVKYIFNDLYNNIIARFSNIGTAIGTAISSTVARAVNSILSTATRIINNFINAINNAISVINALPGVRINKISRINVPQLATGTGYVPEDQMAYIHKGEAVIPKKFNSAEYFSNINDNTETNNLLLDVNRTLLDILDKDTNLYVNGKELARTTYNDFQSEANRLGKSSVVNVR